MHLTLKQEACRPAANNFLQQQAKFDDFIEEFNGERPHQGIDLKYPNEIYSKSKKQYNGVKPFNYLLHDKTITVTNCGRICSDGAKIHLSQVFAGQDVGIKQVEDLIWLVSFMDYDLGYFDITSNRFSPLDNPFKAKVLPMSSEDSVTHVSG